MPKVVYLFGAGASIGTLPIVDEMKDRINEVINVISADENLLSDNETFQILFAGEFQSKRKHQETLIEGLKELKKICETHFSVDTYAKKLSIKRDFQGLKKLKILLSFFFVVEQILHRPNPRYDFFLASLIDSIDKLPKNVRILSWNYDTQFEIAFSEFSQNDNIFENQKLLRISKRNDQFLNYEKGEFGIFKLNGSTEFRGGIRDSSYNYNLQSKPPLNKSLIEQMIKDYVAFSYVADLKPIFSFAWEESYYADFSNIVIEETQDAQVLVVIGYSFPYFNREIDKSIISKMTNLTKVYFQSPEANELMERFISIREDFTKRDLVPISDLRYFYIPNEIS